MPANPSLLTPNTLSSMTETRFWLIRHALVEENARAMLYGIMDVPLVRDDAAGAGADVSGVGRAAAASGCLEGHAAVPHPPHGRGDLRRRLSAQPSRRSSRT